MPTTNSLSASLSFWSRPLGQLALILSLTLAVGLALGLATPAVAQESADARREAVAKIKAANTDYDKGDFRAALLGYRQAYEITEDPRVLYRIGLTYENLANYQRAREHLELYLLAEPDSKYAGRIKIKVANLRKLEKSLQAYVVVASNPSGARIWMQEKSGKSVGLTPLRIPVGPGEHTVVVELEGRAPIEDTLQVEAGTTVERTYDLGGGVTQAPPAGVPEPAAVAEERAPAQVDEASEPDVVGQTTYVSIGPPTFVSIIAWPLVVLGPPALAIGMASPDASGLLLIGAGAGSLLLGGYLLWMHDWSSHLPPAHQGSASSEAFGPVAPAVHGLSYGVAF